MKRIVVTGVKGLIGWHAAARLHAANCAARFQKQPQQFDVVLVDHEAFGNQTVLQKAVADADAVLHFAGINRAPDDEVERGNPAIASQLIEACKVAGSAPHIVFANSTHSSANTPYGRSKRIAGEMLGGFAQSYTDIVLPHIFGECARPNYNNVTATLIDKVISGTKPELNPDGRVSLLHAGEAAQTAINAIVDASTGTMRPQGTGLSVVELHDQILSLHRSYEQGIFPKLDTPFAIALFNSYRAALYPRHFPWVLKLNTDPRGTLFEAVKQRSGGQTFLSWTEPGVTRGDHFHLGKVERFLVLEGEATIRIRKVLGAETWSYKVSGAVPSAVDIPTIHTHSIENTGDRPLLTLFWTNDLFDPANPDTFADPVLGTQNV
jgi:UDP-2-acetamido-2,6-beta-L-arabino-hexul-4-ose reductase